MKGVFLFSYRINILFCLFLYGLIYWSCLLILYSAGINSDKYCDIQTTELFPFTDI